MRNVPGVKWFIWVPFLFLLDQVTKWWALTHLWTQKSVKLFPGLDLTLTYNHGVAFSLFSDTSNLNRIILVFVMTVISLVIAVMLIKTSYKEKLSGIALTMILGGALGNLFDRAFHGYVVDFIDFHIGNWHWYIFNIADCFVTIGALLLALSLFCPSLCAPKEPLKQ